MAARTLSFSAADSWNKSFLRTGHAGAGTLAPPNTLKSFALALDMGVDMVEFDVRPCRNALILTHDDDLSHFGGRGLAGDYSYEDICTLDVGQGEHIPILPEVIDLIKGRALMCVDLKGIGYESDVLAVLREKRVLQDVLICSLIPQSLRQVRRLEPSAKTSFSYPEDRAHVSNRPRMQPVVTLGIKLLRRTLPYRILRMLAYAQANAATLYHRVISPATVHRIHRAGGRVFAWTIDDLARMQQVKAMGVDGITTNRPDLFTHLE